MKYFPCVLLLLWPLHAAAMFEELQKDLNSIGCDVTALGDSMHELADSTSQDDHKQENSLLRTPSSSEGTQVLQFIRIRSKEELHRSASANFASSSGSSSPEPSSPKIRAAQTTHEHDVDELKKLENGVMSEQEPADTRLFGHSKPKDEVTVDKKIEEMNRAWMVHQREQSLQREDLQALKKAVGLKPNREGSGYTPVDLDRKVILLQGQMAALQTKQLCMQVILGLIFFNMTCDKLSKLFFD